MPPEHSAAWIGGGAVSAAIFMVGLPLEIGSQPGLARHFAEATVVLGAAGFLLCVVGYLKHYERMTHAPLSIRHGMQCPSCVVTLDSGERRWHLSVLNRDEIYMVNGVQLRVAFLHEGHYILEHRLLKWVGEQSSRRDIAAREDPHAEIAGITPSGQHYLSLWGLVDGRAHPGNFVGHQVAPGDYIAEITITSDRRPVTQWVHIACTRGDITVRRVPEPDI